MIVILKCGILDKKSVYSNLNIKKWLKIFQFTKINSLFVPLEEFTSIFGI